MKKFTIIGILLIIGIFAGLIGYVSVAEDFEPPLSAVWDASDTESWDKTVDDLFAYLEEKGLIDLSTKNLVSEGVASEAFNVNGAEFYWWDLENLEKESQEYISYTEMQNDGIIDVWGMGSIYMPVVQNGPFGLNISGYTGDSDALLEAFENYCKRQEIDYSKPVWSKTLDDLAVYMEEQLFATGEFERININFGTGADGRSGYRYNGNLDLYYYDFDEMSEGGTAEQEYDAIRATGSKVYSNGDIGYYWVNGPFMLHFYQWSNDPIPEEERQAIIDIFEQFCKQE